VELVGEAKGLARLEREPNNRLFPLKAVRAAPHVPDIRAGHEFRAAGRKGLPDGSSSRLTLLAVVFGGRPEVWMECCLRPVSRLACAQERRMVTLLFLGPEKDSGSNTPVIPLRRSREMTRGRFPRLTHAVCGWIARGWTHSGRDAGAERAAEQDGTLAPMKGRWRRLLKPGATAPHDAFRWTDKRSVGEQVAGGFRKAGGLIGGFAVMMASFVGLAVMSDHESVHSDSALLAAWSALGITTLIMVWTANRWAPFVTGFFFGPAVLKIAAVLFLGSDTYYSSHSISRTELAEFLVYALAVVALTARFVGNHPAPTTVLDRFALTFFVLASSEELPCKPLITLNWCGAGNLPF